MLYVNSQIALVRFSLKERERERERERGGEEETCAKILDLIIIKDNRCFYDNH